MNGSAVNHEEVKQLLGAFALDAVDPDEVIAIREHLASCPRCASEVDEHQQMAGLLANSGGDAPPHLWGLIEAQIKRPASLDDDDPHEVRRTRSLRHGADGGLRRIAGSMRHSPPRNAIVTIAAAVVLVIIVALGVQVTRLDGRVTHLQEAAQSQGLAQAAQSAMDDPRAQRVFLTAAHTSTPAIAEIVILPTGSAFLVDSQLAELPSDKTYQLWGKLGDQLISLGLLGSHPDEVAFRVDPSATLSAFAITAEQAGGVVRSTQVPVAVSQTVSA